MTDEDFLSLLFENKRGRYYLERDETYIQARADELIASGNWNADEKDELVELLNNASSPKGAFQGIVIESFRREALRCMGHLASQVAQIPVGFMPTGEFNAFAVKAPSGGHVVILNSGLESALQLVFHSYLAIATYPFDHAFDRSHDILDFVQSIVMVADSVATGTPDGVVNMPTWDCHEKVLQDDTMLMFVLIADVFVMLHEYGHVVCGHLEGAATRRMLMGDSEEEVVLLSHTQEFEADEFALRHLRNFSPAIPFAQIFYPVGVFFRFLDLCEEIGGRQPSVTHPPALQRWQRLKSLVSELELTDPDVRNVDAVFDNISKVYTMLSRSH